MNPHSIKLINAFNKDVQFTVDMHTAGKINQTECDRIKRAHIKRVRTQLKIELGEYNVSST